MSETTCSFGVRGGEGGGVSSGHAHYALFVNRLIHCIESLGKGTSGCSQCDKYRLLHRFSAAGYFYESDVV